jgi:hypothetical protein
VGERGRGRVGVDLEQRGVYHQPTVEHHTQFLAGWEGPMGKKSDRWTLKLKGVVDLVRNEGYVSGEDETNGYLSVKVDWEI